MKTQKYINFVSLRGSSLTLRFYMCYIWEILSKSWYLAKLSELLRLGQGGKQKTERKGHTWLGSTKGAH